MTKIKLIIGKSSEGWCPILSGCPKNVNLKAKQLLIVKKNRFWYVYYIYIRIFSFLINIMEKLRDIVREKEYLYHRLFIMHHNKEKNEIKIIQYLKDKEMPQISNNTKVIIISND